MIDILRDAEGEAQPLTFIGLAGKKVANGYSIENSKEFGIFKASGDRANRLKENTTKLLCTPAAAREILQQASISRRSYKDEMGRQCNCKLLSSMHAATKIKDIDEDSTLWQLNWVEVAWPQAEESELCTKDGRLFFETYVRDGTGMSPRLRMNEESALALAQLKSKTEFLTNHNAGKHSFPAMATVKILREEAKRNDVLGGGTHSTKQEKNTLILLLLKLPINP